MRLLLVLFAIRCEVLSWLPFLVLKKSVTLEPGLYSSIYCDLLTAAKEVAFMPRFFAYDNII